MVEIDSDRNKFDSYFITNGIIPIQVLNKEPRIQIHNLFLDIQDQNIFQTFSFC